MTLAGNERVVGSMAEVIISKIVSLGQWSGFKVVSMVEGVVFKVVPVAEEVVSPSEEVVPRVWG